jgi:hypothetical protein
MSTIFAPMDIAENDVFKFNFAPSLRSGETLVSAVVQVTTTAGNDPKPEQVLQGALSISGAVALQAVRAHAAPVSYHFRCVGTLSSGRDVTIPADMDVKRM